MSIMQMVYQAGLNNGLSSAQARAFTAEVGRENDFQEKYIFGEHRDSNRDNVGIISWNQGRRTNLYKYLASKGIPTKGGIERSQRALDAQMGFAIHEIKTNPAYKATKRIFLDNPNVDYRTAEKVLGKNFIRWDYAGNSLGANVKKHHAKRDKYYAQLGGKDFEQQQAQPVQQADPRLSMSAPDLLATLRKGRDNRSDNDIFIELANNNGLAGREVRHLLEQGASPTDIAGKLGLNVSVAQQAQPEPEIDLPDVGTGYEDFMARLGEQDAPEPEMQLPDIGKGYEDFMANLDIGEPQTQVSESWQTQNNESGNMSQPKNARAPQMLESSWESLS